VAYDERARIFACGDVRSARSSASRQRSVRAAWRSPLVHQYLREIERDAGECRGRNVVGVGAVASAGNGSRSAFYHRATKLRDSTRTESTSSRLNKPQKLEQTFPLSHPGGRRFESG
jgi:hypothetical protein